MSITLTEGVEISRILSEIKGSKIKRWVSEDTHEDIEVVDEKGNRFEIKYYPVKNADELLKK